MEVAVSKPEAIFNLYVDISLTLQKRNCSNPITLLHVVL